MNGDTFSSIQFNGTTNKNTLQKLSGLGTAETIFSMGTDTGTANAFVSIPQQTGIVGSSSPIDSNANAAILGGNLGRPGADYRGARPYFNSSSFDCRLFQINVSGRFTTSAINSTTGHAINLYQNTSAALGGNLLISVPTSTTLAAGNYGFFVQATLMWDSVSQLLIGETVGLAAPSGGATGYATRTSITPISVTSPANLLFVASVKFNTGAANTVTPVEFNISQI